MATAVRTQETMSERWARALQRAVADGLDVLVEPISGAAFVESASNPGTLYQVSTKFCTCKGGMYGAPCKHRACYLAQLGELPGGSPPALAIVEPVATDVQIAA